MCWMIFSILLLAGRMPADTVQFVRINTGAVVSDGDWSFGVSCITGKIRSVIDNCYPLHRIADAFRYVEGKHARGKVVITMC